MTLPKSPNDYKPELPKDFQAPQGIEYKLDENHPLLPQARALMHDIDSGKLSGQEAFQRVLALHAAGEVGTIASLRAAREAEVAKLGATGSARVTAIQQFLAAQLGPELGAHMNTMLVTARHVEGFERIMAAFRGQTGSNPNSHREPPAEPGKVNDEQWAKMPARERLNYSRGFDQSQFQRTNGAGR